MVALKLDGKVARGVKLLNKIYPGWYRKVKLNTLDMGEENKCILGQLYGNFYSAVKGIGVKLVEYPNDWTGHNTALNSGAPYGFSFTCAHLQKNVAKYDEENKQLTETWKAAIRKLRGK